MICLSGGMGASHGALIHHWVAGVKSNCIQERHEVMVIRSGQLLPLAGESGENRKICLLFYSSLCNSMMMPPMRILAPASHNCGARRPHSSRRLQVDSAVGATCQTGCKGAAERVFRDHQQQLPAWLHIPGQLAQTRSRIGQMLEHPAADYGIEHLVRIREPGEIGGDVSRARILETAAGALKHLPRIVEAGDHGVGIGSAEKEPGIASVAAAGVEQVLAASNVEGSWVNQPTGQRLMAGDETGHR